MRSGKLLRRGWLMGLATILLVTIAFERPARTQGGNTIYVDTTAQGIDASDGYCSLQEAIYSANFDNNIALNPANLEQLISTECLPGHGDDIIVLPSGAVFLMTTLLDDPHNPLGPTATPIVLTTVTIEANGSRIERIPSVNGPNFRAFAVATTVLSDIGSLPIAAGAGHLTIRNAHIKGFTIKGGNGAGGGGGGMGAGGAIYVFSGGLTVEDSTFEDNGAGGGHGSTISAAAGGGGGGLSGNGGHAGGLRIPFIGAGGGGGSRGNGGNGAGWGGAGGGTVLDGGTPQPFGFRCGGPGGRNESLGASDDGDHASCPGGGGGGGQSQDASIFGFGGDGGDGKYGGGGGGGGYAAGDAGDGGFGGGGGAGTFFPGSSGGGGGGTSIFGGGGGAGQGGTFIGGPGKGGTFGGDASEQHGGGGGALGGAIFSHGGTVIIRNSTFTRNFAVRGLAGGPEAEQGQDAGGAIFSVAGSLTVLNSTISGNETTGEGGGVAVYKPTTGEATTFTLYNTIIANGGDRECLLLHSVTVVGSHNLIEDNAAGENPGDGLGPRFGCPALPLSPDPQLGSLQLNLPGMTPTMAIGFNSRAFNQGDPATSLPTDQRGVARPAGGGPDIGAYEYLTNPDFSLHSFTPITATPGGTGSTQVIVHSVDGFNSLVKLEPAVVPAGLSVSFTPDSVTPAPNDSPSSTLNVSIDPSVPAGTYALTVRGIAGANLFHDLSVVVNVQATLEGVMAAIRSFGESGEIDSQGISTALTTKVALAQRFVEIGQVQSAVNVLYALLYQIEAQAGKHISIRASDVLTADVLDLQGRLGGNLRANAVIGTVVNASNAGIAGATVSILNSANKVIASTSTDATGLYFFTRTAGFAAGSSYTVKVSQSKPSKSSTLPSRTFSWSAVTVILGDLVVN